MLVLFCVKIAFDLKRVVDIIKIYSSSSCLGSKEKLKFRKQDWLGPKYQQQDYAFYSRANASFSLSLPLFFITCRTLSSKCFTFLPRQKIQCMYHDVTIAWFCRGSKFKKHDHITVSVDKFALIVALKQKIFIGVIQQSFSRQFSSVSSKFW